MFYGSYPEVYANVQTATIVNSPLTAHFWIWGQQAGCEAAEHVHAMSSLYDSQTTEAILLVDANNAFNSLNREVALRNIQHLCPSRSVVLINTYHEDINLFVNCVTLLSAEGTTQCDLLAMAMYGIGILPPLIKKLRCHPNLVCR